MTKENVNIDETKSENDKIIFSIEEISRKIKSRKICNLNNLEKYSDFLDKLESQRNEYENATNLDIVSLDNFATSADTLSDLLESIITRYQNLSTINCQKSLNKLQEIFQKLDRYTYLSEKLALMMQNIEETIFYQKYTKEINYINDTTKILNDIKIQDENPPINKLNDIINLKIPKFSDQLIKIINPQEFSSTQQHPTQESSPQGPSINIWVIIILFTIIFILIIKPVLIS